MLREVIMLISLLVACSDGSVSLDRDVRERPDRREQVEDTGVEDTDVTEDTDTAGDTDEPEDTSGDSGEDTAPEDTADEVSLLPECWDGVIVYSTGEPATTDVGLTRTGSGLVTDGTETSLLLDSHTGSGTVVLLTCGVIDSIRCLSDYASVSTDETISALGGTVTYTVTEMRPMPNGEGIYDACHVSARGLVNGVEQTVDDVVWVYF